MISCPHYSREDGNKRHGLCAIGRHNGKPFAGQCLKCIASGQNIAKPGQFRVIVRKKGCRTCKPQIVTY